MPGKAAWPHPGPHLDPHPGPHPGPIPVPARSQPCCLPGLLSPPQGRGRDGSRGCCRAHGGTRSPSQQRLRGAAAGAGGKAGGEWLCQELRARLLPCIPRPLWIIQTRPICSCPCPCPFSHTQRLWMPGLPLARDVGQEFVSKMTRPGVCREQSLSCCSANEHRDKPDSPKPFHPRKGVLSSLGREKVTVFT